MKRIAIILAALMLAGCGSMADSFTFWETKEKPIPRDVMPANFKREVVAAISSVVDEQRGIRGAYYSDPVMDSKLNIYVSCARFDARDATGQYVGPKEYAAYYYGGHLNQFVAAPPDQCRSASYRPFPEIENLCPGGKCSTPASVVSPKAAW
jgi:hypothetical protein